MEHIENYLDILNLCGLIFILTGIITYFFPPKKINSLYGYRTSRSMLNQKNWTFAQTYSSVQMIYIGIVYLIGSALFNLLSMDEVMRLIAGFAILILGVVYMFWKVEKAIKKQEAR